MTARVGTRADSALSGVPSRFPCRSRDNLVEIVSPCAKSCHVDSHAAAMRIVPAMKMHNDFEKEFIVHRE